MPYQKDLDGWHSLKKQLETSTQHQSLYFYEREIWYCSIGHNLGYEQDGTDTQYWRPVVIVKKFGANLFVGIPLTSKVKNLPSYFGVGNVNGQQAMAIISQIRALSPKRLANKIGTLDKVVFEAMKKATQDFMF